MKIFSHEINFYSQSKLSSNLNQIFSFITKKKTKNKSKNHSVQLRDAIIHLDFHFN